jgi:hypothetical protein
VRDRLAELGDAEVVVVTFTRPRNLAGYRHRFVAPLTVVTDETRAVYRAYGFRRGPWWRVYGLATWRRYLQLLRGGARLDRIQGDTLQLGGDVVVGRDGHITYIFRSRRPDDRPPVDDLIAAVHRTSPL